MIRSLFHRSIDKIKYFIVLKPAKKITAWWANIIVHLHSESEFLTFLALHFIRCNIIYREATREITFCMHMFLSKERASSFPHLLRVLYAFPPQFAPDVFHTFSQQFKKRILAVWLSLQRRKSVFHFHNWFIENYDADRAEQLTNISRQF